MPSPAVRIRTYTCQGDELPSVTSVLKATWPSPALARWMLRGTVNEAFEMRVGYAEAKDPSGREHLIDLAIQRFDERGEPARTRGKNVHKWAEAKVLGGPLPDLKPTEQGWADACLRFHDEHSGDIKASEMVVAGDGWAGTLDLIKETERGLTLVDYKTAGKKGPAYPDQAAQIGGYSLCSMHRLGREWQDTDLPLSCVAGVVVKLYGDGTYDATWVDLVKAQFSWLAAWMMYQVAVVEKGGGPWA